MFSDLIFKNRSYRRYNEEERLSPAFLQDLIEFARLSPSSRNQQALKFKIVSTETDCEKLFPSLAWAGYLKGWEGPVPGERPSAYIVVLGDKDLGSSFQTDLGICSQSILLGAVEAGFGGCMIGSIKRAVLRTDFDIPEQYEILLVIALGKPIEEVLIEEMKSNDTKYWRDDVGIHHVPKRGINELIV